jgi:hypothetical protein
MAARESRFVVICPACAVTVGRADDRDEAAALCKAAEHGDVDPELEPYVHDTQGVGDP